MKVYLIGITWDCHGGVWCAVSAEIPLALECASFDELLERVKICAPEIIKLNGLEPAGMLHYVAERRDGVC
ncbi:MAG: DUF1902 domain-containing protein [Oscillospiraceae bacterium]|nr:DUF1902 domain-containing protein [Oscillospiraceae bacterium]